MIIKYNQFLNEKLLPSQFRKYVKEFDTERYKDIFNKFKQQYDGDKNAYRIYLPLVTGKNELKDKIENLLKDNGYVDVDYFKGTCRGENTQNQSKIGKILTRLKENELLKKFGEDPKRKAGNDLLVCISRHPYDIAGADTDRNWTNCMTMCLTKDNDRIVKYNTKLDALKRELERVEKELETNSSSEYVKKKEDLKKEIKEVKDDIKDRKEDGCNIKYLKKDVKQGSLISYLIKSDDKNINNPIANLNIKPYINEDDKKDIILVADNSMYGNGTEDFKNTVNDWLNEFNGEKHGVFRLDCELYDDGKNTVEILKEQDYIDMKNDIIDNINRDEIITNNNYINYRKLEKTHKNYIDDIKKEILKKEMSSVVKYLTYLNCDDLKNYKDELEKCDNRTYAYYLYKIVGTREECVKHFLFKDKLINYFKNCGDNFDGHGIDTDYIDLFTKDYILDLFTKDDIFDILSNKPAQLKIKDLLIKNKITFKEVLSRLDIKTFSNISIDRIFDYINEYPKRLDEDDIKLIVKLFDDVFEIKGSRLINKITGDFVFNIFKSQLNQLLSYGIKKTESDVDIKQEIIKIFDKNNWEQIITQNVSEFPFMIEEIQEISKLVYNKEIDLGDITMTNNRFRGRHRGRQRGRFGGFGGFDDFHGGFGGFDGFDDFHGGFDGSDIGKIEELCYLIHFLIEGLYDIRVSKNIIRTFMIISDELRDLLDYID